MMHDMYVMLYVHVQEEEFVTFQNASLPKSKSKSRVERNSRLLRNITT
jgi:hypothetical protein